MKKIINIILLIILFLILGISVYIIFQSFIHPEKTPSVFGYKTFIVLSDTMKDEINPGDLVIVKNADINDLKEGDIISFKNDETIVTHRIKDIVYENETKKFITKGDKNIEADSGYVIPENIEGKLVKNMHGLGDVEMFIKTPAGAIVTFSIPIIIAICIILIPNKRKKEM